jgi:two-component system nitrate/nitrite response regulator NarL
VVWPNQASIATVSRVFKPRSTEDQPTSSQCVRFSFEAATLRQAVDAAGELRRVNPTGVRVRPAPVSHMGSFTWAILVTMPALEARGIAAVEEEMCRIARRAPGIRFTGWLYLSASVERVPPDTRSPTAPAPARVLIVDESGAFRRAARELLERRGYRVVGTADTAAAGFEAVEQLKPDAVLLDVRLPDGSGLDLCEVLTREPDPPAILLISSDGAADTALAKARGARGFVPKADLARVDLSGIWG